MSTFESWSFMPSRGAFLLHGLYQVSLYDWVVRELSMPFDHQLWQSMSLTVSSRRVLNLDVIKCHLLLWLEVSLDTSIPTLV